MRHGVRHSRELGAAKLHKAGKYCREHEMACTFPWRCDAWRFRAGATVMPQSSSHGDEGNCRVSQRNQGGFRCFGLNL